MNDSSPSTETNMLRMESATTPLQMLSLPESPENQELVNSMEEPPFDTSFHVPARLLINHNVILEADNEDYDSETSMQQDILISYKNS